LEINVVPDRVPPYVVLSDGSIRNGYVVKILNKLHERRQVQLSVRDLTGAQLSIAGLERGGDAKIEVATDDLREIKVYVTAPASTVGQGTIAFTLVVTDVQSKVESRRKVLFRSPPRSTGGSQ
jgi:polyferredoxin